MHELNPSDIESMQVLKDASFGQHLRFPRCHGVIIITTKQGQSGKMNINFGRIHIVVVVT